MSDFYNYFIKRQEVKAWIYEVCMCVYGGGACDVDYSRYLNN